MSKQQMIDEINSSIRQIQYNEWGNFEKIDLKKNPHDTIYDSHNKMGLDYGCTIYLFEQSKFNYEFSDFVARCILSDDFMYHIYKQYDFSRHYIINNKLDFESHIRNFYSDYTKTLMPKKQDIFQGYTFGDGNNTYIFIQFDKVYVMYNCFGS